MTSKQTPAGRAAQARPAKAKSAADKVRALRAAAPGPRPAETVWSALDAAAASVAPRSLSDLFDADARRFETFSASFDDLLLDYSKEKLDHGGRALLLELAQACDVEGARRRLFDGELVNGTEGRAARHNILRAETPPLAGVAAMREQFLDFAEEVRAGRRLGVGDKPFTDVVNIGIGGSYLGPRLVVEALQPIADGPRVHFVSNVDPWSLRSALRDLDPSRTLFICASKSFRTQETTLNLRYAVEWLTATLGPSAVARHVCAVTARPEKALEAGVDADHIFQIWDWAGGRFSVWSSIGLCAAIAVGRRAFEAFLDGGAEMDDHFEHAPLAENLPTLSALLSVWRRSVQGYPAYVLAPYEDRLAFLPDYVQQLEMESLGKSVGRDGAPAARATAPAVFGGAGTNAQHSFFQKLHQGPDATPVDFLVGVETATGEAHAQKVLLAHCLAQSQALMRGRPEARAAADLRASGLSETLAAHLCCPGDRPSSTMMYRRLDARTLGRLLALFEHKTFVQATLWGVECFDQWGVELGKQIAGEILPVVDEAGEWGRLDPSTRGLLDWRRRLLDEPGDA